MCATVFDSTSVQVHFDRLCEFGGRLCGSPGEQGALNYVRDYLNSLKTGNVRVHPVEYDGWQCIDYQVVINGQDYDATPLPGCPGLPENGVNLNIVDAGRGTPQELQSLANEIQGQAVLVTHEYMFAADHVHRTRKLDAALSLGAAVFIIANPWDDSGMVSGDASSELPAFGVSKKTADALRVAAKTSVPVHFKLSSHRQADITKTIDYTLSATVEQSGIKDNEIIICAHIDGHQLSQSAMDNASGVAVALALAGQIAQRESRLCTIRILIFSAEERGLIGSQKFVASLSDDEKKRIIGVLNLDCVAGSSKLCAMTSGFDELNEIVVRSSTQSGITVEIFEPLLPNSDHYNFANNGIPALRLIAGFGQTRSHLRHVLTSADKCELVKQHELENALKVTASMIAIMANS